MSESLSAMETNNEDINGYVYMVIPEVLKGTNRVKIGMSVCNNEKRIKSYGKGVEIVVKHNCSNPRELEKCLKKTFNHRFNLIQGKEYFEGDISEIEKIFYQVINQGCTNVPLIKYYEKNKLGLSNDYKISSKDEIRKIKENKYGIIYSDEIIEEMVKQEFEEEFEEI